MLSPSLTKRWIASLRGMISAMSESRVESGMLGIRWTKQYAAVPARTIRLSIHRSIIEHNYLFESFLTDAEVRRDATPASTFPARDGILRRGYSLYFLGSRCRHQQPMNAALLCAVPSVTDARRCRTPIPR